MTKASDKQVWKEVPDWEGYEVSSCGLVRSWKPIRNFAKPPKEPRLLSQKADKYGYKVVRLFSNGESRFFTVHKLVLWSFEGPPSVGLVCRHLDGDRQNNNLQNLKWGTPKENSYDSFTHGTKTLGEKVNTAVLSEEEVKVIRKLTNLNYSQESKKYGVTPATIRNAFLGITWKHV